MRSFLITGVSRGLGEELFEQLAADPEHRVIGVGRTFTDQQRELAEADPDRISLHKMDFAAATPVPAELATHGVTHACLILNAGMVEPVGAIGALDPAVVRESVAVNLAAPMIVADAFVRALPPGTPGSVLFISSGAATRPIEGWAAYCAAKAGGEMFFRVLAEERPDLYVASVNPGRMDTGMQGVLRRSEFPTKQSYVDAHERGCDGAIVLQVSDSGAGILHQGKARNTGGDGTAVGTLGELHPKVVERLGTEVATVVLPRPAPVGELAQVVEQAAQLVPFVPLRLRNGEDDLHPAVGLGGGCHRRSCGKEEQAFAVARGRGEGAVRA